MPIIYSIDADADVLLLITPPPTPSSSSFSAPKIPVSLSSPTPPSSPRPPTGFSPKPTTEPSSPEPRSISVLASPLHHLVLSSSSPTIPDHVSRILKVSSRHLTLSSRRLKTLLFSARAQEQKQPDGRIHLALVGFEPRAVTIVMDAVHARGAKVPRALGSLEALAEAALVVDELQCLDAVAVYAERWLDDLLQTVHGPASAAAVFASAATRDAELGLWAYVAYVFRRADLFRDATRTAAVRGLGLGVAQGQGGRGLEGGMGLPVREKIIRDIATRHQLLVTTALARVYALVENLRDGHLMCAAGAPCDSLLLGGLVRTLYRTGVPPAWLLASSSTRPPIHATNFWAIVGAVRAAQAAGAGTETAALLWRTSSPPTTTTTTPTSPTQSCSKKRKSPAQLPASEVLRETPSNETAGAGAGVGGKKHECAARRDWARELEELVGSVEGLELESETGYCLY